MDALGNPPNHPAFLKPCKACFTGRRSRLGTKRALQRGDRPGCALVALGMSSWMTSMSRQMPDRLAEVAAVGCGGNTTVPSNVGDFAALTVATGQQRSCGRPSPSGQRRRRFHTCLGAEVAVRSGRRAAHLQAMCG